MTDALAPQTLPWPEEPVDPSPAPARIAALGVEHSLGGRNWLLSEADDRLTAALAQRLDLPEIVARVMAARGIGLDAAASFLDPRLRELLPDPSRLADMRRGSERLAAAITAGERIAVFGDYDVDGATAAALLLRFLRAVGADPLLYVPDRLRE
ncbi:MAG TPA: single-stranded-DNA-specific exonuclease RecJ, partial [Rhodospirillales bacterium]|nr:single-stranded-DNA-specific exonuclease RecJ [Rhodospirillales bacterium]